MTKKGLYNLINRLRNSDWTISTYKNAPPKREYDRYADELEENIDDYLWCSTTDDVFEEIDCNLQSR